MSFTPVRQEDSFKKSSISREKENLLLGGGKSWRSYHMGERGFTRPVLYTLAECLKEKGTA